MPCLSIPFHHIINNFIVCDPMGHLIETNLTFYHIFTKNNSISPYSIPSFYLSPFSPILSHAVLSTTTLLFLLKEHSINPFLTIQRHQIISHKITLYKIISYQIMPHNSTYIHLSLICKNRKKSTAISLGIKSKESSPKESSPN